MSFDQIDILRKIPLFRTLTLENLHQISDKVETLNYGNGEVVFNSGDEGDSLYIIKSGSATVYEADENGDEIELAELISGSYFGEMALLTGEPRSATVKTSNTSTLMRLAKDDFQMLLNQNAAMYIPIAYVLSQRLKEGNEKRLSEEKERRQKYTPSGHLSENSVIDILKYCEENALTGEVILKCGNDNGLMIYLHGEITEMRLNDQPTDDLLSEILNWSKGTFRIEPTPFLFRKRTTEQPEPATDTDTAEFRLADLIAVMNLITAYAIKVVGKTIVENFLKQLHQRMSHHYLDLHQFSLQKGGLITLYEHSENRTATDHEIIAAAAWMRALITQCGRYDVRFETLDIQHTTHSYYDILNNLGFYDYYYTAEDSH